LTNSILRRAALALGANLGDREATFEQAIALIGADIGRVAGRSSFHETEAVIHPDDPAQAYPPYLNAVVVAQTSLAPAAILDRLQAIERRLGRDRGREAARWRPRLIDLDIVALEDLVVDEAGLAIPHPEMHRRAFVLVPMAEIWPEWRHPRLGLTVRELLGRLEKA
jgi:2-amino-4-hydroxy-6-hydroxymethyldihydropteridine diphosphokinase